MNTGQSGKAGPLRFRGHQEHTNDLTNLEQQSVYQESKVKSSFRRMRLFTQPVSFSSWDWVPWFWITVTVLYLGLMTATVNVIHSSLPSPKMLEDISVTGDESERFVAARSQADLLTLISNGPRPVGSKENEEYAVNFIKSEVLKVKENANKIHTITITDQIVSGSYFIDQRPVGYVTQYHNVQNIIVRLSSNSKKNSSAVLVNCHFDSVPGSPGASDDAFHCTVMLELLRILSRLQNPFLHDIIFLFNGAEESGLQASHGFIAHHEWAKDVKIFVNLEASGAGGKEVLFQSGPNAPWLLEAYAQAVPHPHGNVMAEELFQGGVIPSDTDFRIFRDFGHVPGFDFANADNGFVYHTKFDNGALVPLGSFQHTGDNMLALLQALANSPLLDLKDLPGGSMIYFDLLGFCFVKYSQKFGLVLNVVVSLLSLGTILCLLSKIKKVKHGYTLITLGYSVLEIALQYGCAITTTLGGWILSVVYIYLLTMFLNWMKLTQSWYRSYFYLLSLYYFSTVLFCVMVPYLVLVNKRQKLSNIQHCKINSLATQFIWTLLLLLGAAMGIRSSYIIMILVLCPTLSNLGLLFYRNHGVKTWVIFQFLQSVLPMLMGIYLSLMVLSSFIPITNRSGSGINIELAIGILCASTCIMNVSYLVPFTVCMRHISVVISLVSVHILGLLILIVSRPLPFYNWPSGESGVLQRVPLWHVQRTLHDESGMVRLSDSGFWMINMDCSSPHHLKNVVTELNSAVKASSLCESELFCALPLYSPRMSRWINDSIWIQGPKPFDKSIIHMATQIDSVMGQRKRMSFNISGPNQLSFMFSPLPGVTAVDWSLEADLVPSQKFKGRPSYFVFYQKGLPAPSWTFYIDFQIDTSRNLNSNKIVTVGLVGSEINSNHFSKDYKKLINSYPDWAFITPRASELKMWEL